MPQGPLLAAEANLVPQGAKSVKNITGSTATIVKTTPGTVLGFAVITAPTGTGQTAGQINDMTTGGTAAIGNRVGILPTTAGAVSTNPIPCNTGIAVTPPTGGTTNGVVAVYYI